MIDETKLNEKIARIDRLETRFSDSFMKVGAFETKLKHTEEALDHMRSRISDLSDFVKGMNAILETEVQRTTDLISAIHVIASKLEHQLPIHEQHIAKYAEINCLDNSLKNCLIRTDKLEQKQHEYASKAIVDEYRNQGKKDLIDLQQNLTKLQSKADSNQDRLDRLSIWQTGLSNNFDALKSKLDDQITQCKSTDASIEMIRIETPKKLSVLETEFTRLVDKKVNEKLVAIDPQKAFVAVKDSIKNEITNIATDASNASLKYNNIDAQVKLIEKKIENLYLLIKKIELSHSSL